MIPRYYGTKELDMSWHDGEVQKRVTMRMTDAAGYLLCELNLLVPESMVRNVQTDWINTLKLKAATIDGLETRIDVVIK